MKVWEKLRRSARKAGDKTSGYTRRGRIKIEILGLKREIEEKFIELGGRVFQLAGKQRRIDLDRQKEIAHLVEQLKELEHELQKYEEEMKKINLSKELE